MHHYVITRRFPINSIYLVLHSDLKFILGCQVILDPEHGCFLDTKFVGVHWPRFILFCISWLPCVPNIRLCWFFDICSATMERKDEAVVAIETPTDLNNAVKNLS